MKKIILCLLLLCSLPTWADKQVKKDSVELSGRVEDSFTRDLVDSVFLEILLPDTVTVVDTLWNLKHNKMGYGVWGSWEFEGFRRKLPSYGHYLVRCTKRGYKPSVTALDIPRKKYNKVVRDWEMDAILLKKSNSYDFDSDMKEVTVTATRIKMFQDGDTVVYNADAFELSDGSMLDELIRQLPGVELKDGGQIYVNGNKVDELLLNGKHFFQGDAKVALDNLPAYMVQNVKAYQKAGDQAYLDKHHEEMKKKDPWVIDVNLKREYHTGWIGNVEGGYGTDNRYMGRLFLTRFTDHSRITAYASANNVNNAGRPGQEGSWMDWSSPTGEMDLLQGGLNLQVDDKESKTEFNTSLTATRNKSTSETDQSSVTFLTGGDIFSRSRSNSENTSTSVNWDADLRLPKKDFFMMIRPDVGYSHSRNNGNSLTATFTADPEDEYRGQSLDSLFAPIGSARLQRIMTNRTRSLTQGTTDNFRTGLSSWMYTVAPWNGEMINIDVNANYSNSESKSFEQYDLHQSQGERDYRNRYTLSPSRNFSVSAGLRHDIWEFQKIGTIGFNYNYSYNYNKGDRSLYDLHNYDEWGAEADRPIGMLPSTTDSLNTVIDAKNSYNSSSSTQEHRVGLSIQKGGDWGYYNVDFDLNMNRNHMEDTRNALQPSLTRNFTLPRASFSMKIKDIDMGVNYSQSAPSMNYLMDVRDDSNPLSISEGNANLKNTSSESIFLNYSHNSMAKQSNWGIYTNVSLNQNSIGNSLTYNRQTGVYTYRPENINGNWSAGINSSMSLPLDKNRYFTLNHQPSFNYNCSVDFANEVDSEQTTSKVHNYSLNDMLTLRFQKGNYTASLNAQADYTHATSARANFSTINTVDFNYGISGSVKSPNEWKWSLQFDMDLTMHSRRGYDDASMNENNLVWNAALSTSFLKGRPLTLKLIGHDILQQLASVQRNINAQGRTETWYNTQPSYAMLTLSYRLNLQPKKKKQ